MPTTRKPTTATKGKGAVARKRPPRTTEPELDPVDMHPLSYLIPPISAYETYSDRQLFGDVNDLTWLEAAWDGYEVQDGTIRRPNVLVEGPTGAAKSSVLRAFCALHRIPLLTISGYAGVDLDALIGGPGMAPDGTIKMFVPGPLTLALIYGRCVIEVDEMNYIPPKELGRFNSLFDARRSLSIPEAVGTGFCTSCSLFNDPKRIEEERAQAILAWLGKGKGGDRILCEHCGEVFNDAVVIAKPDILAYATQNPGYEGTFPINEAMRNRFSFIMEWGYNSDAERQLLWSEALVEFAGDIRSRYGTDFVTPLGTNRLMEFEAVALSSLGFGPASEMLINSFAPDERDAVRRVLEQYAPQIIAQLAED